MTEANDLVLIELDKEIARLQDELRTAQEMRSWWSGRHPRTASNGTGADESPHSMHPRLPVNIGPKKSTIDRVREIQSDGIRRTPPMIRAAAEQDGWRTTSNSPTTIIRNALKELMRKGEMEKIGEEYVSPQSAQAPSWGPARATI